MDPTLEAASSGKSVAGMLTLPYDVYEIIVAMLHYDKKTLCSLASTNRHLYLSLGTLRFREVTIRLGFDWQSKTSRTMRQKWLNRLKRSEDDQLYTTQSQMIVQPPMHNNWLNSLHDLVSRPTMLTNLRAIRSMIIKDGPFASLTAMKCPYHEHLKDQWSLVKRILQQAVNLKTFSYDCCLPFAIDILAFLETERPRAKVEVLKWYQDCQGPSIIDPLSLALAKSPSLNSMALGEVQCLAGQLKSSFGRIAREAPNLRILRYGSRTKPESQHTRNHCCQWVWPYDIEPWSARHNGEGMQAFLNATTPRMKAIEELKISSESIDTNASFPFDNFWQSFLDLSKLRVLDLASSGPLLDFEKLSNSNPFTGLRKLSFRYRPNIYGRDASNLREAICNFLDSCSLEALALFSSYPFDIKRLLGAQTDTLSFLLIEWYPTATDLYYLRDEFKLEFLGINTKLPHEDERTCNVLVTFEHLRCLRLRISTLSMGCARPSTVGDGPISDEDWEEVMHAVQYDVNPNEDAIFLLWNFIASKWCGRQLPKVAMRASYRLRARSASPSYRGYCEAFWVIEPKGAAHPGSTEADFYRGFDLVGFENYKVASFSDVELGYPRIPMAYADRVDRY